MKLVKHPNSYKVMWIDPTSLDIDVQERCQISIQFATYTNNVWCDILPIDVGHIILGRSWLFDLNVFVYGQTNHCLFVYNGKKVKLMPNQPKSRTYEMKVDNCKEKIMTVTPEKKVDEGKEKILMNLISHDQVEKSMNEGSTCYALLAQKAESETEDTLD